MAQGHLLLILHAHLPYVRHPEFDRFLEERWFFEAVIETYVPLVKFFDKLKAEGTPFKVTLSVSPPLANMMEDPLLQERCARHMDLSIALAEKEVQRTKDWPDVHFLAQLYHRLFREAKETFEERCGRRLVQAFKEFAASGHLELITCAGTHGFLPVLRSEPGMVRAQIFTAIQEHQRIFGQTPAGMWLPECAFYPGLDEVLPRPASATSSSIRTPSSTPTPGRSSASPRRCTRPPAWPRSAGTRRRRSSSGAASSAIRRTSITASTTA